MKAVPGVSPIITVVSADHQPPPRPAQPREAYAQPFKFRWLEVKAREWRSLSPVQNAILDLLFLPANLDGGEAYPRHDSIAEILGLHIKTVRKNLRDLEAMEWIVCVEKGGRGGNTRSKYHLRIPNRHFGLR